MGTHCYGITLITSHETWLVHTSVYQFTMPNAKKTSQNVIRCLSETTTTAIQFPAQHQMLILFRRIKKVPQFFIVLQVSRPYSNIYISIQVVQLDTLLLRADGRKTIISFEFCNGEQGGGGEKYICTNIVHKMCQFFVSFFICIHSVQRSSSQADSWKKK